MDFEPSARARQLTATLGGLIRDIPTVAQLVGRLVGQAEQIIEQRLAGLTGRPGSACR
ncbi:MAG TPA: hypothetical protein VMV07_19645 [Streptosporangiaceae bacterium]|nr:hypothetical protein [Streptosporangiaceae bacterium]